MEFTGQLLMERSKAISMSSLICFTKIKMHMRFLEILRALIFWVYLWLEEVYFVDEILMTVMQDINHEQ